AGEDLAGRLRSVARHGAGRRELRQLQARAAGAGWCPLFLEVRPHGDHRGAWQRHPQERTGLRTLAAVDKVTPQRLDVAEARTALGAMAEGMTDAEVAELVDLAELLAEAAIAGAERDAGRMRLVRRAVA